MKKEKYVSPEFEVIDMMVEGDILAVSGGESVKMYDDETVGGSNAYSSHRTSAFPWSEDE